MDRMKIGDRVLLRKTSTYWGQSKNRSGTITNIFSASHGTHVFMVTWDYGDKYDYRFQDLMLRETEWDE